MSRPKLTKEEKEELGRWRIEVSYRVKVDKDTLRDIEGSGSWGIDVFRGSDYYGGHGGIETLDEALKIALDREYRGRESPLGYSKPIPPSQVSLSFSAKYLRKHGEFREEVADLMLREIQRSRKR